MSFLVFLIIPILLGLYAQSKVSSTYAHYSKVLSTNRLSGRDAAAAVMASAGIDDVQIVAIKGHLTDHYDPSRKTLALSEENYFGTSVAALGVAAHEAGHAIQHKQQYAPLNLRMALVPVTNFASQLLPVVMFGGFFLMGSLLPIYIGIGVYLVLTVFQLVTLPVEFDASARAKSHLSSLGIVNAQEGEGVAKVLDAAALTYVAAFVTSLGWLLHLLAIANNRD